MGRDRVFFRAAVMGACLLITAAAAGQSLPFAPIGLPSSRSPSPVFNRYASLPPFTASLPGRGEWFFVPTLEISQAMISSVTSQPTETTIANLDFEVVSLELPLARGITDRIALELDIQVQYLWGGFLDGIITAYHDFFGFPNGGREGLPYGQVVVNVDTMNGLSLRLDGPALLVSDPVLGAAFRLVQAPRLDLTLRAIASAPLGLGKGLTGNTLPQLGAGVYADWRPAPWLGVHVLAGGILPLESFGWTGPCPYPMLQARASLLAGLGQGFFLFLDLNFRTSPVRGYVYEGAANLFGKPNADLLAGFLFTCPEKRQEGRFGSFTVQEDPFSHNASDVRLIGTGAFRWGKRGLEP